LTVVKRKKYISWTADMVAMLCATFAIIIQKKDMTTGGLGKINAKGWRALELEV
jgi:hypothetical protein